MSDRLHPNDLRGNRCWWLLDLVYAGMTIRLSDREGEVLTDDGDSLHYHGVLDVLNVGEGLDFLSDASASPTSVSVACVLPVDVPLLIARGHDLSSATGTLRRWVEGTTFEAARVVIVGGLTDPEHGSELEPVSFTLESVPWEDSVLIPSSSEAVVGANWDDAMIASLPEEALGLMYPIVIGHPGQVSAAVLSSGRCTGSQGVYVDQRTTTHGGIATRYTDVTLVIAGHHVTAATVYLNTQDSTTAEQFVVLNTYDRAGHAVAIVPWWKEKDAAADVYSWEFAYNAGYVWGDHAVESASLGDDTLDPSFNPTSGASAVGTFVLWVDDADSSAGGMAAPDGTTMREAGDVLEWLLSRSGMPVDRGRFAAAKPLLRAYKFDFTIDAQVTPWEFAASNLLPLLPVCIVSGPSGLYPVVWRHDARVADAVVRFDTGIDPYLERASNVSYDRSGVLNDFTLAYALSIRTGNYLGEARLSADASDGALPSYPCALSQRRYRRPDGTPLVVSKSFESPCVYADGTAYAILAWMAQAYAFARRRVDFIGPEQTYGHVERGMVGTITDAGLHWTDQVCLVEDFETDGSGMIRVKLLLVEEPILDSRDA